MNTGYTVNTRSTEDRRKVPASNIIYCNIQLIYLTTGIAQGYTKED